MKNKIFLSAIVIAILCIAWLTVHAQLQKTNSARQTWEYKTLQFFGNANIEWKGWLEDGNTLPLPVDGTAKRRQLGNEGWELVSVATFETTGENMHIYTSGMVQFFKRPK